MADQGTSDSRRGEIVYHGRKIGVDAARHNDGQYSVTQVTISLGPSADTETLHPQGRWGSVDQALKAGYEAGRRHIDDQDFDDDDDDDDDDD